MPNPLFLKVMGVTIHEYNTYSPAKKARFQKTAQEKLAEVHEGDIDSYTELTAATAKQSEDDKEDERLSAEDDKENS